MNLRKSFFVPAFALLAFLLSPTSLPAQDEVRSVQEELCRRSLYFGNVDGRESAELAEATKRYQRRKGFTPTGRPDHDTLRSLGLVPRAPGEMPPKELNWPAEPVLKSDEKIDPVAVAKTLSEETGIAPASLVPDNITRRRGKLTRPRGPRSGTPVAPTVPQATGANSPVITPENMTAFVKEYLAAMSSNDVKRELKFYADKVNYYHNGVIDRRIVEQTLRRYHARWPNRRYRTGPAIYYRDARRGEITMIFRVAFTLKDGRQTVAGQTENRFRISAATVDPRINSIEEKRVRP